MKPKICQKYQLSENLNSFELPLDRFKLADQPLALLRLPSAIVSSMIKMTTTIVMKRM